MTYRDEQSLLSDSYSTRRDAEVEPCRYERPVYVRQPGPRCRQCDRILLPDELEEGACDRGAACSGGVEMKDKIPTARVVKIGKESQMKGPQAHIDLLGKTAKDRVTGFQGVVESVSFDLYGCIQVAVKPPLDKEDKMQDGRWFDVHRLELLGDGRVMPVPAFGTEPPKFGPSPDVHTHGPAEKPAR